MLRRDVSLPEGQSACIRRGNANGPCCPEMRCRTQDASRNHGICSLTCQIGNSRGRMCLQGHGADHTFGPGLGWSAGVPCTPSGGHHVNVVSGKGNTGQFRRPEADRGQSFGPVDYLLAWQITSDNTDKLLFAHNKGQSEIQSPFVTGRRALDWSGTQHTVGCSKAATLTQHKLPLVMCGLTVTVFYIH
ncbi:MAG: hypothetical protein ABF582_03095 [Acetobacter okinawensis]